MPDRQFLPGTHSARQTRAPATAFYAPPLQTDSLHLPYTTKKPHHEIPLTQRFTDVNEKKCM